MSDSTEESIPISRLNQEIERRKALEAQLGELRAKAKSLEDAAGTLDQYRQQVETLQSDLTGVRNRSEAMLGMAEAGVTDSSVRDFIFYKYSGQDSESRKDWGDWWQGEVAAPSAVLRPFVQPDQAAEAVAPQAPTPDPATTTTTTTSAARIQSETPSRSEEKPQEPSAAPRPNANGGAAPQPLPGPAFAPGELARMAAADPKAFAKKWREGEFRS